MGTLRRRIALQLEKMETRELLSSLPHFPNIQAHDYAVRGPANPLDRPAIEGPVHSVPGQGTQAGPRTEDARVLAQRLAAIPKPPFAVGEKFSVSGANFPVHFKDTPKFDAAQQDLAGGRLKLTINSLKSNGSTWIDLFFRRPDGGLAGNTAARWQDGPIGGIKLAQKVTLDNFFFYFTVDGKPVTGNLGSVPNDIYADSNPIASLSVSVPQVFFFTHFTGGTATGTLSLGSGISSGTLSYATFLQRLNVPIKANGLHLYFQVTPV